MKFIQIRNGLSVRKSDIESVERVDVFKSKIITRFNEYEVGFPYDTILKFLEMEGVDEKAVGTDETNDLLKKIINNQPPSQYFAG